MKISNECETEGFGNAMAAEGRKLLSSHFDSFITLN